MGEMLYDVPLYREVADLDIGIGRTKVRYRGLAKNTAQLAEQFSESAKLGTEIRKNLAGLGY